MRLRSLTTLAAAFCVAVLGATPALAQQADVIRGRVIGPDSAAVEGATVTATSISGGVSRTARTDRNGRFNIMVPNGDGDYMISVAAMGFVARRFEVKRIADEEVLIADAKLQRMAAVLDAVKVEAPRDRVARTSEPPPDIGGTEQPIVAAGLPAADMGDLAAMAATMPGVSLVPGENGDPNGYSVLGLGADQNQTTLNGSQFGGSNLPRDAAVSSSLATSPYDVSRGGFSGAQLNLRTRPGSNFKVRGVSLNAVAPQTQWTDAAARALGQESTDLSLGGLTSGPIVFDKAFYSVAYQVGRRSNDYMSLRNTGPLGLQTAGVSPDSAARFVGMVRGAGIPTVAGAARDRRDADMGSVFGSVDFAPPTSRSGHAFNLAFDAAWNRQRPAFGNVTDLPAAGGEREGWRGGLTTRHSGYILFGILSETSVGFSTSRNESDPFLRMPAGRVRVNSTFEDGTSGVQTLGFGGAPFADMSSRNTSASFLNQLSWFSGNNKHRLKLTGELRRDSYEQEQNVNTLGTWSYQSLEDLQDGTPSSFTRQLGARRSGAAQLVGGLSLGDAWRPSPDVQLQFGVRADGNRFLDAPERNAAVESRFGVRNDRVPDRVYLSPRVGFSWTLGNATQVAAFEGAARTPRAVVRGGAGLFQNTPNTMILGQALDNTGLPGAVRQLGCVGDAVPLPEWDAYAANPLLVPDECADGTSGSMFANSLPNVTLFDRDWQAPRSWRSNLQWSGAVLGNRLQATLEGVYSLNLNQSGFADLNFDPTARFTLPDEGGRPIYVETSSIVPATGAVSSRGSRLQPEFGRVTELRSNLRSQSRQLSLRVAPLRFGPGFNWSASYVLSDVREQGNGFSSTAGDPRRAEWGPSTYASRHQVIYSLGYDLFDAVRLSWFGSFRSGTPYTPLVAGDLNGDGYANDRAFVFDPDAAADPALASAMRELLGSSRAARECLGGQTGRLAGRNSCRGPWTSTATLSLSVIPGKVRMPQRANLSLQLSNPLGAADLLVNGSDDLRGWGQTVQPDPALLYVRGFDPGAQRFSYEVNQRFGNTSPSRSAFRAPVTLTAMLRFDLGPTREEQALSQQLDRGRRLPGQKLPAAMLRAMYSNGGLPNPMAQILRQQDSLELTAMQADSIASLNRWYVVRADSLWSPVALYLGGLPDDYDGDEAWRRYLSARRASVDLLADLAPVVKALLTPTQRRKLPPFVASYLEPRYLASIRSGTGSFTGSPMMPSGGGMGGNTIMVGPGGSTTVTHTVIRQ